MIVRSPILLTAAALVVFAALLPAAPEPTTKPPEVKIEEIEKAGEAFKKGNFEEAFTLLKDAVKRKPELPPARLMLARLFLAANQGQAARVQLEQAAAEASDHPEVYLQQASIALAEGRLTETLLCCQTALTLADAERWTADQKKTFRREARAGMAASAEARKDWATARMHLTSWLDQEPKNGQARQRLARSLFLIGSPDDALVELDKAVKDEPSLESPAVSMGRLWALKGDAKKAGEWFEKAAQKEPESARVHQAYGEWLLEQGRIDEAKIHADAAARLDPKAKETDRLRGLIARHSRDYATAEKVFDGLLRDAPADFFASNQLALVLAEQKEEDKKRKAVQLAEVNARQYQRNADALATLGWVYWRNDRGEEAEKALSLAVSGGQATSDTAFYLATVLDKRGKKDDIQKLLQSAVDTTGPFVFRKEATAWLDELKKTAKPK